MKQVEIEYITAIDRMRDGKCPVCGQSNVDYGDSEYGSSCYQEASCQDCSSWWAEHYTLNHIEIHETVDQEVNIKDGDCGYIEHLPEILNALLNQKKMLPAFIGIDKFLDDLIAEKLKE